MRPAVPQNQPSGEDAWNGPPRMPPPDGRRITSGSRMPERQWVFAASVTMGSNAHEAKSANCSSTTGRSPIQAAPTAAPTNPSSAIGVSITRSPPNSLEQPPGHAERAAEVADVLAQHEDALVCPHGVGERA